MFWFIFEETNELSPSELPGTIRNHSGEAKGRNTKRKCEFLHPLQAQGRRRRRSRREGLRGGGEQSDFTVGRKGKQRL